ncbi:hypothetical protein J3E72DRAFT_431160 [Bipolaris maydis]|nr:hypothetical protein J3E72DRAFT_431160 [Bipolaris maydis]
MEPRQNDQAHPQTSPTTSTTTTTTTHGPHTTISTTDTTPGQGTTLQQSPDGSTTITHPTVTTTTHIPAPQPSASQQSGHRVPSYPLRLRSSSVRSHRTSHPPASTSQVIQEADAAPAPSSQRALAVDDAWQAGRRRSSSEPRPPPQAMFNDDVLRPQLTGTPHLQPLYEHESQATNRFSGNSPPAAQGTSDTRRGLIRTSSAFHMRRNEKTPRQSMMGDNVVDVLDVIG